MTHHEKMYRFINRRPVQAVLSSFGSDVKVVPDSPAYVQKCFIF